MIAFHTGIQALRNFKVKALNKKISALIPNIELISSEYIHFIESKMISTLQPDLRLISS